METLKPLADLLSADPRLAQMMIAGAQDDEEPNYTLVQHYNRYAMLPWPKGAPEEIVSGFVTAQHLAIYAWFVFPFSSLAGLQAIATLEHALRRCMANEPARGLKSRLRSALATGLIRGEDLRVLNPYIVPVGTQTFQQRALDPYGPSTLNNFIDSLPEQRNWLAHGNWRTGGDKFIVLDIVLQLINQLYPESDAA